MCDTLYKKTPEGFLFAKNSDRSPNEPNLSLFIPAKDHQEESLACTYVTIPQVKHTHGCILVCPSWTWGAEMGVNEYGVTIGNEAVFTRSKAKKSASLIGMDYVRLALERADSARKALDIIVNLLEVYNQGGNCGFDKPFYYDNSYLIADMKEAWILETAGKSWVAKPIFETGNISNRLSIRDEAEIKSKDAEGDFYKKHVEPVFTHFSCSYDRQFQGAVGLLSLEKNHFFQLRDLLKSHHPKDEKKLFSKGSIRSLCMHYSLLGDHTTSSMVLSSTKSETMIMMTSASTPCLALYKPVFYDAYAGVVFDDRNDAFDYWLAQETIRRAVFSGLIDETTYREQLGGAQKQIDDLIASQPLSSSGESRRKLVKACLKIEQTFLKPYLEIANASKNPTFPRLWKHKNKRLGINVLERDLAARTNV